MSAFSTNVRAAAQLEFGERRRQERQLANDAAPHLDELAELLGDDEVHVRRTSVELLRTMPATQGRALSILRDRLAQEPDVKTRRRIANAIGDTGGPDEHAFLVEALSAEAHRYVQSSLILALGSLGFRDWPELWASRADDEGPVGDALRRAMANAFSDGPTRNQDLPRPFGRYVLRCYPGSEPLVELELARHNLTASGLAPGLLDLELHDLATLEQLARLRTIRDDYHLVSTTEEHTAAVAVEACRVIARSHPAGHSVRFRLGMEGVPRLRRRKLLGKYARLIERELGWVNSTSSYEVNVEIMRFGDGFAIAWHSASWPRVRRPADRETVAASIHPSVGAGLGLLATAHMNSDAPHVLLDPCCGSGTILAEHSVLFPRARCVGFDLAKQAVAAAKANLDPLGDRVQIRRADMRKLPLEDSSVDVAVANLPFGIRTKVGTEIPALYRDAAAELRRVLKDGAPLVAYVANLRVFRQAFRRAGWRTLDPYCEIDAGGLRVHVVRLFAPAN